MSIREEFEANSDDIKGFIKRHEKLIMEHMEYFLTSNPSVITLGKDYGQRDEDFINAFDFVYELAVDLGRLFNKEYFTEDE